MGTVLNYLWLIYFILYGCAGKLSITSMWGGCTCQDELSIFILFEGPLNYS